MFIVNLSVTCNTVWKIFISDVQCATHRKQVQLFLDSY